MSMEWYLLTPPHNQVSGYEGEALIDFAAEGFAEVLDSEMAMTVELCNYDLSICTPIRAIVQNNVKDSKLNTLIRQVLTAIGTCKAGMYIKYKNRYWLIVGLVDDNMMYEKAVCVLCNYKLTWVNANGKILQRWANISSASQYNNGETSSNNYFVRSDQLMVLTPDDDECLLLNSGQRFIIDRRCSVYEKRFDKSTLVDTSNPVIVYQITRADSVLFDYQDSGHFEFMAYQDEQHAEDGYYVVDGTGYWLCSPPPEKDETSILSCDIECDSDEIYAQLDAGIFTAKFYNADGNEVDADPIWTLDPEMEDYLNVEYVDNSILISTDATDCINKSFTLTLSAESYAPVTREITIKAFL